MATIQLKAGREKSVLQKHPWIFSGAVAAVNGAPLIGDTVDVLDSRGGFLARAAYSPLSQIRARVWTWDENETVDVNFLRGKLEKAIALRRTWITPEEHGAMRLVNAESDGIPGLVVDQYDDALVIQVLTAGAEAWRNGLVDALVELTGIQAVYERSDVDVRRLEGLPDRAGAILGDGPWMRIIHENGIKFKVDLAEGQKTGFYLDQKPNRKRILNLSKDREVLNCFCYTGGFSLYALAGGAKHVLSVDSSADALAAGMENAALNGFSSERMEWQEGDVFNVLRKLRDQARQFDLIVLDPPKFAPTAAQVERAARGYKDINLLAFKLLRPGGLLFTFSCSGGVSPDLFQKIIAGAALDAGVDARITHHMEQGPDHPVAVNFPEGAYLKGLVLQVS